MALSDFNKFAENRTEFFRKEFNKILDNKNSQFATLDSLVYYMIAEGARWRYETLTNKDI